MSEINDSPINTEANNILINMEADLETCQNLLKSSKTPDEIKKYNKEK